MLTRKKEIKAINLTKIKRKKNNDRNGAKQSLTNTTNIRNGNELLEIHTLFYILISVSICILIRSQKKVVVLSFLIFFSVSIDDRQASSKQKRIHVCECENCVNVKTDENKKYCEFVCMLAVEL